MPSRQSKQLLESRASLIFGICLGHQLLALASGAQTVKMPHGHHGANHPVQDIEESKQVIITSQNHGFAVDGRNAAQQFTLHSSIAVRRHGARRGAHRCTGVFSFQGHPEASPGPQDCIYLFDRFIEMMADATSEQATMPKRADIEIGADYLERVRSSSARLANLTTLVPRLAKRCVKKVFGWCW